MLAVLLGGARSGKSTHAVELGRRHTGPVVFVATAPALDDDMRRRIEQHRRERPDWPTIEEVHDLVPVVERAEPDSLVVVDCITLWVSNLMWRGDTDEDVEKTAMQLAEAARRSPARVLAVSNEVGLGVHPETDLGRRYRDLLGRVNTTLVGASHRTLMMIAGRAVTLEPAADPWS